MPWKTILAVLPLFLSSSVLAATQSEDDISESLKNKIRMVQHMALNPLLIKAVRQQNSEALDMETIKQREQDWQAGGEATELKKAMSAGKHASLMQRFIDENRSLVEIYLTDNQGANIAAYPLTDDYWQGDDEEWIESFNSGKGQVFIAALKQDEKTNSIFTHVAAPVFDRNKTIGVLVVGVRLGAIE